MTTTRTSIGSTPNAGSCSTAAQPGCISIVYAAANARPSARSPSSATTGGSPVSIRIAPAPGCSTRYTGIGTGVYLLRGVSRPSPRSVASGPRGRWKKCGIASMRAVRMGCTRTPAPSTPPGRGRCARLVSAATDTRPQDRAAGPGGRRAVAGPSRRRALGPRDLDGVLRRRVARDDVVGRLGVGAVDDDVRLARRHVEQVAGLDHERLLEALAPADLDRAREHVERALAVGVVVRARARAGRDPEAGHVDVRRARGRLRDLRAAEDAAGHLVLR